MKRAILFILCCVCVVSYAKDIDGWTHMSSKKEGKSFIKKDSIKSVGKYRQALILLSFNEAQTINNKKYYSAVYLYKYDCQNKMTFINKSIAYEKPMAKGKIIVNESSDSNKLESVAPDSIGEIQLKYVCLYKIGK